MHCWEGDYEESQAGTTGAGLNAVQHTACFLLVASRGWLDLQLLGALVTPVTSWPCRCAASALPWACPTSPCGSSRWTTPPSHTW